MTPIDAQTPTPTGPDFNRHPFLRKWLTVEVARQLIGKTIRCRYFDVNTGKHKFIIDDVVQVKIGNSDYRLLTRHFQQLEKGQSPDGFGELIPIQERILYEFQGIFCQGSGAERLLIEHIYE